jgi:hypothetical protein
MIRIVLVLCVFIAFLGNAHTYYVSKTGKNTNPGTINAPYKTIQHAINRLHPGDICIVREGTYRETIHFKRDGNKKQPIKWGKSASSYTQEALDAVSSYIGTYIVSFKIEFVPINFSPIIIAARA